MSERDSAQKKVYNIRYVSYACSWHFTNWSQFIVAIILLSFADSEKKKTQNHPDIALELIPTNSPYSIAQILYIGKHKYTTYKSYIKKKVYYI